MPQPSRSEECAIQRNWRRINLSLQRCIPLSRYRCRKSNCVLLLKLSSIYLVMPLWAYCRDRIIHYRIDVLGLKKKNINNLIIPSVITADSSSSVSLKLPYKTFLFISSCSSGCCSTQPRNRRSVHKYRWYSGCRQPSYKHSW